MSTHRTVPLAAAIVIAAAATAAAQIRGVGRVAGAVTDSAGAPIAGVQVSGAKAGEHEPIKTKTNKKGEWALAGIAGGQWNLDFTAPGYEAKKITVQVSEFSRIPPMHLELVKSAPVVDANAEIRGELQKAAGLMQSQKFDEARAIYQTLLQKYPEAWQIEPMLARTYAAAGQPDEALAHLKKSLEHDPESVEVRLLTAAVLIGQGQVAEGQQYLDAIDMAKVKDPVVFVNAGITLINQGKAAQALPIFDKVVEHFPAHPDGYYYRARTYLALGRFDQANADLEKFVSMAPAGSPEVAEAKKLLEQLKK